MSELINIPDNHATTRWKLLTGASALALTAYGSLVGLARAEDADRPQVWIEIGGQAERLGNSQELFLPPFAARAPSDTQAPLINAQKPPLHALGEEGKISFVPEGSNWTFSVALRYGRSSSAKHLHYETDNSKVPESLHGAPFIPVTNLFGDAETAFNESHLILDFQVGKDVGLGLFGREGSSVISAGVRFVQFTASSQTTLHARSNYGIGGYRTFVYPGYPSYNYNLHGAHFHDYTGFAQSRRSTRGVGPSVSWNASLPFAGNPSDMEVTLDLGVNASVLFGRQRANVHHQTEGTYKVRPVNGTYGSAQSGYALNPPGRYRARSVTIPNVGGLAGLSLKFPNAKVSLGYRGDFFFNAMDGGFDTYKSENRNFYGPFATISIGLGG